MSVFRPSLPPAICTTIRVRPCAACAQCAPSCAALEAARTAREKIVGITIPALTASSPSRIIALRLNGTLNGLHGWPRVSGILGMAHVLSIHLVFRQRHQQIEHL